jgi:hypothetical protein
MQNNIFTYKRKQFVSALCKYANKKSCLLKLIYRAPDIDVGIFYLVAKSPTHSGLICVKIPATNLSAWAPLNSLFSEVVGLCRLTVHSVYIHSHTCAVKHPYQHSTHPQFQYFYTHTVPYSDLSFWTASFPLVI